MDKNLFLSALVMSLITLSTATAQQAEAPKIISRSNSKTADQKTVFQIKPGEKITFSVKAEGAEKYLWLVDKAASPEAKGASFQWTVPTKKGTWKILVKTTNNTRRQWVKQRAELWNKWVAGKGKDKFLRDMIDLNTYPATGRAEWIVSTFLVQVKPGESIQKAIDSLPPEGGIVELAEGTHEVTNEKYPPGTFQSFYKKARPVKYSIIIKRSNVTICGTHKSVVRHHDKSAVCFLIPDLEATDPKLYVENTTFRGFATASTYAKKDRERNCFISASHVKNFTVEDIHGGSYAHRLVCVGGAQGHRRLNHEVYLRNNLMEHCGPVVCFCKDLYVINNTVKDNPGIWSLNTDRDIFNMHVIGNHVTHNRVHACAHLDGAIFAEFRDNVLIGSATWGLRLNHHGRNYIIANNTISGMRSRQPAGIQCFVRSTLENVTIVNNLIYNVKGDGILATLMHHPSDKAKNITIRNNIICNNDSDGIDIQRGESYGFTVFNNIIIGNGGYGINRRAGRISSSHNDIWNNKQGNYNQCAAGTGDFSKDPLFADPSKGDFHLRSKSGRWDTKAKKWVKDGVTSPCIDAGDPKSECGNEPKPDGGRVNMGAYGNTPEASKSTSQ
ncbi:MAG: right-handed parallel beta-helix repeat-containing protein [Phycisphaerae bacterium]|nr:right-handed parallel beta-helix repeat-containing protein [Phycisphaerae bacterium]